MDHNNDACLRGRAVGLILRGMLGEKKKNCQNCEDLVIGPRSPRHNAYFLNSWLLRLYFINSSLASANRGRQNMDNPIRQDVLQKGEYSPRISVET